MIPSYREILASSRHPKHEAGRTEARGRNCPFSTPNTRLSCRQTKIQFLSCPLCPTSPSPLTRLKSFLYCKSPYSLHQCRRVLWSHPSLFYLQCVLLLLAPRVLFFVPSLFFSLSPSDNGPGLIRLSLAKSWGLSCLCMGRRSVFTPKYIIAFLASRARLRVGDVIKVRCHRNHPEAFYVPPSLQHPSHERS